MDNFGGGRGCKLIYWTYWMSCNAVVYHTVDRGRKTKKNIPTLSRLFFNEGKSRLCRQERQLYLASLLAYVLPFLWLPWRRSRPINFQKSTNCHISCLPTSLWRKNTPGKILIQSLNSLAFSRGKREEDGGGGGEGAPLMCLRRGEAPAVTVCMFTLVENEANFCV